MSPSPRHRRPLSQSRTREAQAPVGSHSQPTKEFVGVRPKVRYTWQVPEALAPEVCFVGRSNAGKSTLLNAILRVRGETRDIAPVSSFGGRTRTLNWYPFDMEGQLGWTKEGDTIRPNGQIPPKGACIVDCFGLGQIEYALQTKRLQAWAPLLAEYIGKRESLVSIFHLVSAEHHGKLSTGDEQLLEIVARAKATREARGLPPARFVTVLTKCDLHEEGDLRHVARRLYDEFVKRGEEPAEVVSCSAHSDGSNGLEDLIGAVHHAAEAGWERRDEWEAMGREPDIERGPRQPSPDERRARWEAFKQMRVMMTGKRMRGGRGSSTMLPPSL